METSRPNETVKECLQRSLAPCFAASDSRSPDNRLRYLMKKGKLKAENLLWRKSFNPTKYALDRRWIAQLLIEYPVLSTDVRSSSFSMFTGLLTSFFICLFSPCLFLFTLSPVFPFPQPLLPLQYCGTVNNFLIERRFFLVDGLLLFCCPRPHWLSCFWRADLDWCTISAGKQRINSEIKIILKM